MIPTRQQIQDKIDEIRFDSSFSTIKQDLVQRIDEWLDTLNMPKTVLFMGEEVSPKQKILEDLPSYSNF